EHAGVAVEREQLVQQLEALSAQLAEEKAGRQRDTERASAEAGALSEERQGLLRQVDAAKKEQEQAAARERDLEAARREAEPRLQAEIDRLTEALAQSRDESVTTTRSREELAEQIRALQTERAALQEELELAHGELGARTADHEDAVGELERAREE